MKKLLFQILFLSACTLAVQAQDVTAAGQYNEGLTMMKAKDYANALPLLEKAIELAGAEATADEQVLPLAKKNAAIATYYAGNAKRKAKAYDEAAALYDKGIGYNADSYINYVGRAQVLSGKGDKAGAVTAYLEAAGIAEKAGKADKATGLIGSAEKLARISYGKKKYDEAIACSELFLAAHETSRAHYTMAQALKAKKQFAKAATHIDKAIETVADADKDKYHYAQGQIHEGAGNKSKAVAAYKKVGGDKYGKNAAYKVTQLGG